MNTNVRTKHFGLKLRIAFSILFLGAMTLNANAQEKKVNPDGVELPSWVIEWEDKYNVQLISSKDVTLYENGYIPSRHRNQIRQSSSVVKIERNENETLVTIKIGIHWDWNWLFWDKNTCLIDQKTGDRYMLRDIQGVYEPGRLGAVYGLKGKTLLQTLVFPPLDKKVKVVDLYEPNNYIDAPAGPNDYNGGGSKIYNIVLKDYTKKNKEGKIIR